VPGQYLTFQLHIPGQPKPVVRCYSLSDRPGDPNYYRVTIKKLKPPPDKKDAPPGLVSNHFHDRIKVGDIVDVKAPSGQFCLDLTRTTPVAFIAGGVGITPLLSMLNTVAIQQPTREVWFFYGVSHGGEHIMREHLEKLSREMSSLHLNVCYSAASAEDQHDKRFHHGERVSLDLLKRLLPSNELDFYICGPPPMMSVMVEGLKTWSVPAERIFFEAFGPATFKKPALQAGGSTTTAALKIHFARSGKTCAWNAEAGSLLELAEKNGVTIDSGCRAGNCGTCLVAIQSGEVNYLHEPGAAVESGSCLTCIAVPKTALTLDA
jgi:ferredoxin-NADP reductase